MISQSIRRFLRRKTDPLELLQQLAPAAQPMRSLVHVGAHLAQELERYEAEGLQQIMWVEASKAVHEQLAQRLRQHRGPARHFSRCALLADRDGAEIEFREFNNAGMSNSIFSPTDQLRSRWPELDVTGTTETIASITLDSLLAGTPFERHVDVLVIDVQGAELLVLQGATQTLPSVTALICEVSTVPYYDGGVLYRDLAGFLRTHGFYPTATPRRHGDMLFMRNCQDVTQVA